MSDQQEQQPVFSIDKIYVKDLSLEVPNAPEVFLEQSQPEIDMQLASAI
jgi:preprotein translocase subunit SecB